MSCLLQCSDSGKSFSHPNRIIPTVSGACSARESIDGAEERNPGLRAEGAGAVLKISKRGCGKAVRPAEGIAKAYSYFSLVLLYMTRRGLSRRYYDIFLLFTIASYPFNPTSSVTSVWMETETEFNLPLCPHSCVVYSISFLMKIIFLISFGIISSSEISIVTSNLSGKNLHVPRNNSLLKKSLS